MIRPVLLAMSLAAFAPSTAGADCIATCGDICYAPADTAYYRAEVLTVVSGSPERIRLVEHLAGDDIAAVGDEREDIYAEQEVTAGDFLFVSLSANTDGTSGYYVYNVARLIEDNQVVCEDRTVDVDQFAAMAASPDCEQIRSSLDLDSPPCDDTVGCNAGGAAGLGGASALLLMIRRRRRR